MTWFPDQEGAEALLAKIDRRPEYTYTVALNGCFPAWGITVLDADGNLITESYTAPEEDK